MRTAREGECEDGGLVGAVGSNAKVDSVVVVVDLGVVDGLAQEVKAQVVSTEVGKAKSALRTPNITWV